MGVPVGKRRLSEMMFFHNAIKLRKEITMMLLRNFGVKERARDFQLPRGTKILNDKDKEVLVSLLDKYNIGGDLLFTYPQWLLSHFRESLLILLRDLMMNITCANSIYPVCIEELHERRLYQDKAICICECILQELNHLADVLPVDANKLIPFIDLTDNEVGLLKRWRKSDNKFLKKIQNKENLENPE